MTSQEKATVETPEETKKEGLEKRSPFARSCLFWSLAITAVVCIIIVAVVTPVCVLEGCGRGGGAEEDGIKVNRIIVSFETLEKTVRSIVPPALFEFVEEILLDSSGLHIISFPDSKIMNAILKIIKSQLDLDILLHDVAYTIPQGNRLEVNVTELVQTLSRRRLSQASPDNYEDMLWQRPIVNYDGAWNITAGVPNVVIAVLDTGCDLNHPDLKNNLWVNVKESIGTSGVDDDGNGYIDDIYGYDFAGNASTCDFDWIAANSTQCTGQPIPQDNYGHGTHCAGIAAAAYNGIGVAGVAPNVKIMCLKVASTANGKANYYLSNVLTALDYAYKNGAHIVSASFGPSKPNLAPTASDLLTMANEVKSYQKALDPLVKKDMLIFAAAGNENTLLDSLEKVNSTYNPCSMARYYPSNMMCVAATNQTDQRWLDYEQNQWKGTNYGTKYVDIAAPGRMILSTVPANMASLLNQDMMYWNMTGSSAATPLVAGVAALILSVLGPGSNNYYQGSKALQILVDSSDKIPNLPVRTSSRVNAAQAVLKAQASLTNLYLLTPLSGFSPANQTVLLSGFNETYYSGDIGLDDMDYTALAPYDTSARFTKSLFDSYKYGAGYTLVVRASVFLNQSGIYLMKVSTTANVSDVAIKFGQNKMTDFSQTVQMSAGIAGGWYEFQLRYRNPVAPIDIKIALPGSGGAAADYQYQDFFYTSTNTQRFLYHAPNIALSSSFQVLTRPVNASTLTRASIADGPSPKLQLDQPYNYSSVLPDLSFTDMATGLRDALYPNMNDTAPMSVVGIVHTRLRAPEIPVRFQLTCQLCSLAINNLTILDVYGSSVQEVSTKNSGCMTQLGGIGTHDLTIRFAVTNTSSTALKLAWLPCTSAATSTATTITTHVANNLLWNPSSGVAGYVPGMQCDIWPDNPSPDVRNYPYESQPLLKFRLPIALGQSAKSLNATLMNNTIYTSSFLPSGCRADNESLSSGCYTYASYNLKDVFQSIANQSIFSSTPFYYIYLRCYTYVNRGFRNGVTQARASTANTIITYLGGQTVFRSEANAQQRGPLNAASIAANVTNLQGHYQLLTFEYRHVNPAIPAVGILDGGLNASLASDNFRIDLSNTLLPIPIVTIRPPVKVLVITSPPPPVPNPPSPPPQPRPPSPRPRPPSPRPRPPSPRPRPPSPRPSPPRPRPPPPTSAGRRRLLQTPVSRSGYVPVALGCSAWSMEQVGSAGFAAAVYPYNASAPYEALYGFSSLVVNNYTATPVQSMVSVAGSLSGSVSVPENGAGTNRYVRVEGFFRSPAAAGEMSKYVLRVRDGDGQSVAITMGNITVRNAVEFPTVTMLQTRAEVMLPAGFVPTLVTVKNKRNDSTVVLDLGLTSSTNTTIPESSLEWYSLADPSATGL